MLKNVIIQWFRAGIYINKILTCYIILKLLIATTGMVVHYWPKNKFFMLLIEWNKTEMGQWNKESKNVT